MPSVPVQCNFAHGGHKENGKDGKHQLDDLNTLSVTQNTLVVTQNTLFVDHMI